MIIISYFSEENLLSYVHFFSLIITDVVVNICKLSTRNASGENKKTSQSHMYLLCVDKPANQQQGLSALCD